MSDRVSGGELHPIKRWWLYVRLRTLLNRGHREVIPIGSDESWSNDDVIVRYRPTPNSDSYPITKLNVDSFETSDPDEPNRDVDQVWPLTGSDEQFPVRHYYAVWRIEYSSLNAAFLSVILRVNCLRLLSQWWFDRGLHKQSDRHELLKVLIDLRQPKVRSAIRVDDVRDTLYGPKIRTSKKCSDYHRSLTFVLQSLAESGDIELNHQELPSEITVLPPALKTVADYEMESTRHQDFLRNRRLQLSVAVAMLILAAATFYTRCSRH